MGRFATGMMVAVALSLFAQPYSRSFAQDNCDAVVVDGANGFGDKASQVADAADAVVREGADVRIRTVDKLPDNTTIDAYMQQMQQQCPSWRAPDGGRKNNLIVLMVAVQDRKTEYAFGSQWEQALNPNWERIERDDMNPRFRDGDWAGGIIGALKETDRLVQAQISPPLDQTGSGDFITWFEGNDWSPEVLLLVFVICGWIVLGPSIKRKRHARRARDAARASAEKAQASAVDKLRGLDDALDNATTDVSLVAGKFEQTENETLASEAAAANLAVSKAYAKYDNAAKQTAAPRAAHHSKEAYEKSGRAYGVALQSAADAWSAIGVVNEHLTELKQFVQDPKTAATNVLAEVQSAAFTAADFIEDHTADISPSLKNRRLPAVRMAIEKLTDLPTNTKEDCLHLFHASRAVHATVNDILKLAKQQHDEAEAERQKASDAMRRAREAIDEAEKRNDGAFRSELYEAKEHYRRAQGSPTPSAQLNLAMIALELANPPPVSPPTSGGGWSGGGGSSFGGSDYSGGGSSSFGGSGGGGGGGGGGSSSF